MSTNQQHALLHQVSSTSTIGTRISQTMLAFLDSVPTQPLGFRDLGLSFLEISRILEALEASLDEHFRTNQSFPERAVPELEKVLKKTASDFGDLEVLLDKFTKYEEGGITGRVMKTWRMVFADKDVMRVGQSLGESKGALSMASLLINVNPAGIKMKKQYQALEQRLQTQTQASGSEPSSATTVSSLTTPTSPETVHTLPPQSHPVELDGLPITGAELDGKEIVIVEKLKPAKSTDLETRPPESSSLKEQKQAIDTPVEPVSILTINKKEVTTGEPVLSSSIISVPSVPSIPMSPSLSIAPSTPIAPPAQERITTFQKDVAPPKSKNMPKKVDRSTLTFRTPTSTTSRGNAALVKALISAIRGHKASIVEQLLNRGVDPNGQSDSEEHPVIVACTLADQTILGHLLAFGGNPDADSKTNKAGALRIVCERRLKKNLDLLLEYGADPNRSLPDFTVLSHAMMDNKFDFVEKCLEYGADPNIISKNKVLPINHACQHNLDPKLSKLLIDWGFNVNKPDGSEELPAAFACRHARPAHLKILLDHGADSNLETKDRETIILVALLANSAECVKLLLEHGANLQREVGILEVAVWKQNIEIINMLLDAGAPVNELRKGAFLPVFTVVRDHGKNRVEILKLLLERGGDANLKCRQGWPLLEAVYDAKLVKLLLAAGADLKNCPNVMEVAVFRNNLDTVKLLVESGMSVELGPPGHTPLSTSIRDNRKHIFDYLIKECKADPNHKSGRDWETHPIMWAINGHEEYVEPLLDAGADVNFAPGIMAKAAWCNRVNAIKTLLERGVDIEQVSPNKVTALLVAIRENRPLVFDFLLSKGADPNHVTTEHVLQTAAHYKQNHFIEPLLNAGADMSLVPGIIELATVANNLDGVQILLAHGADIESVPTKGGSTGRTALQSSLQHGRKKIFDFLLSKGADPNHKGTEYPLATAVINGRTECLEPLFEAGANPNLVKGIVEIATWHNNLGAIKFLVDHGCKIEETGALGYFPLETSCRNNRADIFDWLLAHGADPNYKGYDYPLETAIDHHRPDYIKKLLDAGADPMLCKPGILAHAVARGKLEPVQALVESGKVNLNDNYRDGNTPITIAIRDNHPRLLEYLLSNGADPNVPGNGLPIVLAARREGGPEMLSMLLKADADPNLVEERDGRTALVSAAYHGRLENARLLLANGAKADQPNARGLTALDAAAERGHDEIVMLLLDGME